MLLIKKTPEDWNPKKVLNIVEKILFFNKQQKVKGRPSDLARVPKSCKHIKILSPKQMLQRLPIALAQVKAGNISENLLNKIKQIIYSFLLRKRSY